MVKIAIAGGTSPTLGRSIAVAICTLTSQNTPIILARSSPTAPTTKYECEVRQVDYDSPASLAAGLKDIHTVISVIRSTSPAWVASQVALLHAAKKAGVKRFAPSAFEFGPLADGKVDVMAGVKHQVWQACLESGLEVAQFSGGGFMNYLLIGFEFGTGETADGRREKAWAGLVDNEPAYVWDWRCDKVDLLMRDDGTSARVTMTSIDDIGKFVAAACTLPDGQWEQSMQMVGETVEIGAATEVLEEVSGRNFNKKLLVTREDLEKRIERIQCFGNDEGEIIKKLVTQCEIIMVEGEVGGGVLEPIVNRLCPEVKAKGVRDFLEDIFYQTDQ
ncbi:NAD(P)-binding protein [Polychaeton citri CBS 116435]|uniref:NAD(P)-binding protein n=1 Tax=Polychaeton citri CBS 116435 TaxID=1314669 RepID=A0A9P4Q0V2_9PEZI|nr:NAD(P)-binding protein [Polychaeton citri CBS 116435]